MECLSLKQSINCMSASPNLSTVICGGREILKLITVTGTLKEDRSLRVGKVNLNYSAQDIAWHPKYDSWILSAAKNGVIVMWNIDKPNYNKLDRLFKGHTQVVNRVRWVPTDNCLFISAGQDGIINQWDVRLEEPSITISSKLEGARDAKLSPFDPNLLAASFDNGSVLLWDFRRPDELLTRISAHKRNTLCVEWHPQWENTLATCGGDKCIKVWNVKNPANYLHKIQAPENVARVRWVPDYANMIASCSSSHDNSLLIWHLNQTFLPHYEFKGHTDLVTDFLWIGERLLTCSNDGSVISHIAENASRPLSEVCIQSVAFNEHNQLAVVNSSLPSRDPDALIELLERGTKIENTSDISIYDCDLYASAFKPLCPEVRSGNIEETCLKYKEEQNKLASFWECLLEIYRTYKDCTEPWLKEIIEQSIRDTIDFYAEGGELHTAASLAVLMNEQRAIKDYEELLRRLNLHQQAASLGQATSGVEVYVVCGCGKQMEKQTCPRCGLQAFCSVCCMTVKGLYAWCQACGHGGHPSHIEEWFEDNLECPTGCGHQCVVRKRAL